MTTVKAFSQFVGLHAGVALHTLGLLIGVADEVVAQNGLLQLAKQRFFATQVFVLVAFDEPGGLGAVVQNFAQEGIVERWKQAFHTGQRGKPINVSQLELAQHGRGQKVFAVFPNQVQESEAVVQVALNGPQGDTKFSGKLFGAELFALVEPAEYLYQPVAVCTLFCQPRSCGGGVLHVRQRCRSHEHKRPKRHPMSF